MLNNPVMEAMLAPLARRESWELELHLDGKCIAKRDRHEVKTEHWLGLEPGESRKLENGLTIVRT